jgi:hypothetical protein
MFWEYAMEEFFLHNISFNPDEAALAKRLRVRGESLLEELHAYIVEMQRIARPKVFYRVSWIEQREAGRLVIDTVEFHSQVLCVNLGEVHRVFPFLATCGVELAEYRDREEDILRQFWADAIMEAALQSAVQVFTADLKDRFGVGKIASMNPGSLPDWPITQQAPFFELLGPGACQTGVVLNESMLMQPAKSVTGIYFETESGFVNCQLCPRGVCQNRRAAYDPELYENKFRGS